MIRDAAFALINTLVDFNERTQLRFCTVCKSRGRNLHRDGCPVYELHAALDVQAMESPSSLDAVDPQATSQQRTSSRA